MEELNLAILELQEMVRDTPALKLSISQRNLVQKKKTTLVVRKKLILKKNQMSTSKYQEMMHSMIQPLKIQPVRWGLLISSLQPFLLLNSVRVKLSDLKQAHLGGSPKSIFVHIFIFPCCFWCILLVFLGYKYEELSEVDSGSEGTAVHSTIEQSKTLDLVLASPR